MPLDDEPDPFGEQLRSLRRARRLTQRKLATEIGLDFTYLSKLENGAERPGEETVRRLAAYFEVDAEELLALAGKIPPDLGDLARRDPELGRFLRKLPTMSADERRRLYRRASDRDSPR